MDSSSDWTASALFSPSKARVQQAQAKDWASVDAWLAKKYVSKRIPTFERSEEALQALLTLATLNESADEQRFHVDRVEKAALQSISKGNARQDVGDALLTRLNNNAGLSALAEASVLLNSSEATACNIATSSINLTADKFTAERQLQQITTQLASIEAEQAKMEILLEQLKSPLLQAPSDVIEQTSDWIRNTKHLRAKVAEYDDRLGALSPTQRSNAPFEDMTALRNDLRMQQNRLSHLQMELRAYQNLPSSRQKALGTVEDAREELRELIKQRDQYFERLAETE